MRGPLAAEDYIFQTSHTASCAAWAHAVTCTLHAHCMHALETKTHVSAQQAPDNFTCRRMRGLLAVSSKFFTTHVMIDTVYAWAHAVTCGLHAQRRHSRT